eukprot:jgi/Psemu1/14782/gm1.14782_g
MPPHLSYSGGRGSYRGRGRGGRGRTTHVSQGTAGNTYRASHGHSIERHPFVTKNQWIRRSRSTETKGGEALGNNKKDGGQETTSKRNRDFSSDFGTKNTISERSTSASNEFRSITKYSHAIMKKSGQNQLILSANTKARPVAPIPIPLESFTEKQELSRQTAMQCQTLTRTGKHKLVSLASSNAAKAAAEKQHKLSMKYPSKCSKYNTFHESKRRPPSVTTFRTTAKRVKLSASCLDRVENDEIIGNDNSEELRPKEKKPDGEIINPETLSTWQPTSSALDVAKGSKSKPTAKLTDFAYRKTSRLRQRAIVPNQNLHWSKNSSQSSSNTRTEDTSPAAKNHGTKKNMGLVRVHPSEQTPICPTFLKGAQCQDMYCHKRHDVPKEYAMPVCSFFQRHGQCLRGESCVFRHVKVNPRAVVCPCFALLGFCEDDQCKMQHIRAPKSTMRVGVGVGVGFGVSTRDKRTQLMEESLSRINTKPNNVYFRNKPNNGENLKFTKQS